MDVDRVRLALEVDRGQVMAARSTIWPVLPEGSRFLTARLPMRPLPSNSLSEDWAILSAASFSVIVRLNEPKPLKAISVFWDLTTPPNDADGGEEESGGESRPIFSS